MTTKPYNTQLHNLDTSSREKAGVCKSSASLNLSWRRWGWFIAATVSASFILNEIWEMAQMSAYLETAGYPWKSTLERCTRAALGDVIIVSGIYLTGALVAGALRWGLRGRSSMFATTALVGLTYAVVVENLGLAAGRWSYTERMPVVPVLGVGLWPLLQMTLLPPLVFLLAKWWVTCCFAKRS